MARTSSGKGERTRSRLIAAAAEAFSRRGFHGTTTAEIAAAAGCSEPTLFKHFGSKHALLVAALEETATELLDALDGRSERGTEVQASGVGSVDPFEAFVARARVLLVDPRLGQLSRLRNFALAVTDEADLGTAQIGMTTFLGRVADAVAAGQRTGSVRTDASPPAVAEIVLALTLLYGTRSALVGNDAAATQLSPVIDTFIAMLRAPERL